MTLSPAEQHMVVRSLLDSILDNLRNGAIDQAAARAQVARDLAYSYDAETPAGFSCHPPPKPEEQR